jgi:hypothetical protein
MLLRQIISRACEGKKLKRTCSDSSYVVAGREFWQKSASPHSTDSQNLVPLFPDYTAQSNHNHDEE